MFYEEAIIDGNRYSRSTPNGEWHPVPLTHERIQEYVKSALGGFMGRRDLSRFEQKCILAAAIAEIEDMEDKLDLVKAALSRTRADKGDKDE